MCRFEGIEYPTCCNRTWNIETLEISQSDSSLHRIDQFPFWPLKHRFAIIQYSLHSANILIIEISKLNTKNLPLIICAGAQEHNWDFAIMRLSLPKSFLRCNTESRTFLRLHWMTLVFPLHEWNFSRFKSLNKSPIQSVSGGIYKLIDLGHSCPA